VRSDVPALPSAEYRIRPIGHIRSPLSDPADAPLQGSEGAPEATVVIDPAFADAVADLRPGDEIVLLTWLHLAGRDVLRVHPRGDRTRPLTGVFATRSPDRPNPIGLHRVRITAIDGTVSLRVRPLEAVDGTPVVDVKAVLTEADDA
jgi:tRNA-Thr(GGU) m(6)t(6)A37 methyltransferase TsaA